MKYRRSHLVGRKWHKIVFHGQDGDVISRILQTSRYDYMLQSGGHWHLIMIEHDDDLIALKNAFGFTPEEYRGYGDWSKKKYWCAAKNRIADDA